MVLESILYNFTHNDYLQHVFSWLLESETPCDAIHAYIQAEAMVTLVFNAGAEALDIEGQQRDELIERVIWQLRYITRGASNYVRAEKKE